MLKSCFKLRKPKHPALLAKIDGEITAIEEL